MLEVGIRDQKKEVCEQNCLDFEGGLETQLKQEV